MKQYLLLCLTAISIFTIACKKENAGDEAAFSEEIKNFVPQAVIDSMRNRGLKINEGKTPPIIEGIYNITPNICTFDNSGGNRTGQKFADYRYRFRDQDNDKLTIKLDYKSLNGAGGDNASGVGSFLSGNGENFTVFVDASGAQYGIAYKQIGFYTGRKTAAGIEKLQHGFYLVEKGPDRENKIVPVGSSRIFNDTNTSETNLVYRAFSQANSLGIK